MPKARAVVPELIDGDAQNKADSRRLRLHDLSLDGTRPSDRQQQEDDEHRTGGREGKAHPTKSRARCATGQQVAT